MENDLISRQAAIDAIDEWGLLDGLSEGLAKEILADENKVPSAQPEYSEGLYVDGFNDGYRERMSDEPHWIPCSERLPEVRDWYLGVFKEPDTDWINPLPYVCDYIGKTTSATTYDGWILNNCTDQVIPCEYYKKLQCVAWMPLPDPYEDQEHTMEEFMYGQMGNPEDGSL